MKKLVIACLVVLLTACTTSTEYGKCVGFMGKKNPKLYYELSTMNVILAAIFFETIIVPVMVFLEDLECPRGYADESTNS